MLPVKIAGLSLDAVTQQPVLLLVPLKKWIDQPRRQALERKAGEETSPRG